VATAVAKYTPEYAAKIAGVPARMIVEAAELMERVMKSPRT